MQILVVKGLAEAAKDSQPCVSAQSLPSPWQASPDAHNTMA
jgi:hypothetical protein